MNATLKQSSWRGLLQKEWIFQKWTIISLILLNVLITVIETNSVIDRLLNWELSEVIKVSNTWFFLHMYLGLILLFSSLTNEMKQTDVWLHSPKSIFQLVGSKIAFAIIAVSCSFLLCGAVISISSYVGGAGSTLEIIFSYMSTTLVLILNAVFLIMISFFFWSVYQVLKSRLGYVAILLTLILFVSSIVLWAFIWFTDWFQSLREIGSIIDFRVIKSDLPYFTESNFMLAGLMPEDAILTVGSLFLYIVLSSALFIGGATLFEKKVRL